MTHLSLLGIHMCVSIHISHLRRIVPVVRLVLYVSLQLSVEVLHVSKSDFQRKVKFNNYLLVGMRFKGGKK